MVDTQSSTDETKHTPGPMEQWAIDRGVSVPMQGRVAFDAVGLDELITYAREQDAIRADMLAALESALPFLQALAINTDARDPGDVLNPILEGVAEQARDAIAKAKGGAS